MFFEIIKNISDFGGDKNISQSRIADRIIFVIIVIIAVEVSADEDMVGIRENDNYTFSITCAFSYLIGVILIFFVF